MHINSYSFGKIVIDGTAYSSDIIIVGGKVRSSWWRKQGHLLVAEDIENIISAKPSILVVGCGASGMLAIDKKLKDTLQENGIELEALETAGAVKRFNELSKTETNTAAALHLTC